uniref:WD repeat and HMG-box DNA-binding protein 1-like n=1 Tax=Styela clava TaxID=7725 RepID=UPI00193A57BE|nr:WD repeat and HMG-box DNA-binding protein 1-like [Styela clava]
MAQNNLTVKYAHTEGHTEICYDISGNTIFTSGSDGEVKIWNDFEDNQNPKSIKVGEVVHALTAKGEIIYAAADNNSVDKYNLSDGSPDGILLRFTGNATHIALSESQNTIVAGSSDFTAKAIDLETSDQQVFNGHKAPILSVAADPLDEYLATVSCDGDFRLWNMSDTDCIETVKVIKPSNDVCNSSSLCRMSWRPATGEDIAVPSDNEIKVFSRGTWTVIHSFKTALTNKPFNCCAFSPCGRFLAAATVDGWICVWDAETQDCLQTVQHALRTSICCLVWDPKENNTLAIADVRGQVGLLKNAVPSEVKTNQNSVPDDLDALFENEDGDLNDFLDDAAAESDSVKDDITSSKNKKRSENLISDDEMDTNDGKENDPSDFHIPSTNDLFAADDDDLAPPVIQQPVKLLLDNNDDAGSSVSNLLGDEPGESNDVKPAAYKGPAPTAMQPAFQPSATPVYLSHRFMVWNSVGTIRSYTDEMECAIDIEFHDKQHHYALHINNEAPGGGYLNTMADLSMNAIALAAESTDDIPSKLTCIYYSSWEGNKEWSVEMPDDEDIKALTIGESWVAVCTDARLVRMFSLAGMQRFLFSIPGPVVSMSAHTDQLLIAYHISQGFNGNQCLGYMLIEVGLGTGANRSKKIITGDPLPISKKSSLQWIGFSAEGTPVTVDTSGVVRIMNRSFSNTWIPVSNLNKLTKSRHDHYWVIGLHENPQELRAIMCKGSTYPSTLPRPFPSILQYKLPLCEPESEKSKFEEEYWRSRLFSSHTKYLESHGFETDDKYKQSTEVLLQQTLMKMFALACKLERESRAREVCELLPSSSSVNLAIKYASRLKRMVLAQKLQEVAQEKQQEEMEAIMKMQNNDEDDDDDETENPNDFKADLQAGYSHSNTEWAEHKRLSLQKKKNQRQESDAEENEQSDSEADVIIQNGDLDDLPDLGRNTKSTAQSQPAIKLSGSSRNPFKKRTTLTANLQSTSGSSSSSASVLDNISKKTSVSQKLRGVIAKSHSLSKKPALKNEKKQQTLFGATGSKFQLTSTPKGKKQQQSSTNIRQQNVDDDNDEQQSAVSKQILKDVRNECTSGVQLFVSEVRQKISEANPGLDGVEIRKIAIQDFRKLSAEERKEWNEKAKSGGDSSTPATTGAKRKLDDDQDEENENTQDIENGVCDLPNTKMRKTDTISSQSSKSKLAAFAFES